MTLNYKTHSRRRELHHSNYSTLSLGPLLTLINNQEDGAFCGDTMHYLYLRNKTEPKVFQCLCIHSLHLSLTEFLVCSYAFPKPNHFWKAGDPFTFIYLYISPQRTIMFNCYCRLYFTVAQGCVKKGVFGL